MLFLQLFLIGFCLFCSEIGKKQVQRFHLISGHFLDDWSNSHTLPDNSQQILTHSWYFFKEFYGILF